MKKLLFLFIILFSLITFNSVFAKPLIEYCDCYTCKIGCTCPAECPQQVSAICSPYYSCGLVSTTYQKSGTNHCAYYFGINPLCGAVNYYCPIGGFYTGTTTCLTTNPVLCIPPNRTASCGSNTICGMCSGSSDVCGVANCGATYGCSPSPKVCNGQGTGSSNCVSLGGMGSTCYCNEMCTSNKCANNKCQLAITINMTLNGTYGNYNYLNNSFANITVTSDVSALVNLSSNITGWTRLSQMTPYSTFPNINCSVNNTWYNFTASVGNSSYSGPSVTRYGICYVTTTSTTTTIPFTIPIEDKRIDCFTSLQYTSDIAKLYLCDLIDYIECYLSLPITNKLLRLTLCVS